MAVTTNISLHLITSIMAVDPQGFGEPLVLRLKSNYGDTDITLFFNIGDTGLTRRLVEAINAAIVGPIEPPEAACPHEAAAYTAMEQAFSKWSGL
jgi:hypothetical protein